MKKLLFVLFLFLFLQGISHCQNRDFVTRNGIIVTMKKYDSTAIANALAGKQPIGNYVPFARTITINGIAYDLSANRSWTITSMVYPGTGIPLSTGSGWGTSITDNSSNWNTAYTDRLKWDGSATGLVAATGRNSLGGTTIGQNVFTSTNPGAITFGRANADNTFDWLSASDFRTAIGATTGTVTGTGTINYISKWTSGTAIGNSGIFDNGTSVGIGTTSPGSKFDVTTNALGTTQTNTSGISLVNTTAAANGAQQISPAIRWQGNGWKTDATAASRDVNFRMDVLPVQGAANPSGNLRVQSSINGAAYSTISFWDNAGNFTANNIFANNIQPSSRLTIQSGAEMYLNSSSGTSGMVVATVGGIVQWKDPNTLITIPPPSLFSGSGTTFFGGNRYNLGGTLTTAFDLNLDGNNVDYTDGSNHWFNVQPDHGNWFLGDVDNSISNTYIKGDGNEYRLTLRTGLSGIYMMDDGASNRLLSIGADYDNNNNRTQLNFDDNQQTINTATNWQSGLFIDNANKISAIGDWAGNGDQTKITVNGSTTSIEANCSGTGFFKAGDVNNNAVQLILDMAGQADLTLGNTAQSKIRLLGALTSLGDIDGNGHNTKIDISDNDITVSVSTLIGTDTRVVVANSSGTITAPSGFVPMQVTSNDLTGQTAANTSIATYTPSVDGTFRIGGYINITAASASTITLKVTYTDINSNAVTQIIPLTLASSGAVSTTAVAISNNSATDIQIRAKSGSAITVLTTVTGVSRTYDVGATIEFLR